MQPVVLIHGIMRTSRGMRPLEASLRRLGWAPVLVDYPSTHHDIATLARDHLGPAIAAVERRHRGRPLQVVAHSMGGLVLRSLAAQGPIPALHRVVLLGTPNHGSEISDRIADWWLYRRLFGPAGQQLRTGPRGITPCLPAPPAETGIIAGSRPLHPLLARLLPRPNDGKVSLASTHLAGQADHILLPEDHDLMLLKPRVHAQVVHFLRHGRFRHPHEG
jgi:triacylglycerol lipase